MTIFPRGCCESKPWPHSLARSLPPLAILALAFLVRYTCAARRGASSGPARGAGLPRRRGCGLLRGRPGREDDQPPAGGGGPDVEARDHEVRIDGCLSRWAWSGSTPTTTWAAGRAPRWPSWTPGTTASSSPPLSAEISPGYMSRTMQDGHSDIPLAPRRPRRWTRRGPRHPLHHPPAPGRGQEGRSEASTGTRDDRRPEDSEAAARALERENRRRERQGLPPLDELPPAPSTLGWPKLEPLPVIEPAEDLTTTPARRSPGGLRRSPNAPRPPRERSDTGAASRAALCPSGPHPPWTDPWCSPRTGSASWDPAAPSPRRPCGPRWPHRREATRPAAERRGTASVPFQQRHHPGGQSW